VEETSPLDIETPSIPVPSTIRPLAKVIAGVLYNDATLEELGQLKTFFIGSLTAATVLHLFEKRYISSRTSSALGNRKYD
jgi:hypothetical protein